MRLQAEVREVREVKEGQGGQGGQMKVRRSHMAT